MNRYKISFNDLIKEVEQVIANKWNALNRQQCDSEILAFISLYRHGAEQYKEYAKEWLTKFFVNADFVKNKREIVFDEVKG